MSSDPDKNILSELSETYFGKKSLKNNATPKKKYDYRKLLKNIVTILFLIIFFLSAYYFLRDKHIFLDVNIKVETLPPAPSPEDEITETDLGLVTLYDFEQDKQSWEIPVWALEKPDHVATDISRVSFGKGGNSSKSLKVNTSFPGDAWSAAIVEVQQYLDLTGHKSIFCYIYLPSHAPKNLKGKIILTVGDDWTFTEMSRTINLTPGGWTKVEADISPGSRDWRRTQIDKAFSSDIRKIAVRVESAHVRYEGPFYLDNIESTISKDSSL